MANSITTPASANISEALQLRINNRTAKVGVVGLGYVGLPLAVESPKPDSLLGHQRLGGNRRRRDQAVRLYAILSGAGVRGPLYPD